MCPEERHCALLLDEMQITAGLDYEPTLKTVIGKATAPLAKPGASTDLNLETHGLVVMLSGITSHWKQVVVYHMSGKNAAFCQMKM